MATDKIKLIDLEFLGNPEAIAAYLIPHQDGAVLVESGPASTMPALEQGLISNGFTLADVTDVLLTHIHLDHAGAAGFLAREGARVHVHEVGAPHLVDPSRLLASAERIYKDQMDRLWGDVLPVPESKVQVLKDGAVVTVGDVTLRALDTPGHANHHMAYLFEGTCFSGDVGGVRRPGIPHLELPLPPPELDLDRWEASINRIEKQRVDRIAPTHFGIFEDVDWHLGALKGGLENLQRWLEAAMEKPLSKEDFRQRFSEWVQAVALADGLTPDQIGITASVNPSWMSADGLYRYWEKNKR